MQEQQNDQKLSSIIKQDELQKLNAEAETIVKKLNGETETQNLDSVIEQLSSLGEKQQADAGNSLEILKRPVKEMMDNKNSEIPKTLLQLREHVEELNPQGLNNGLKGLINKITGKNPMKNYIRKYQSVQTQIEAIVGSLLRGRDKLQEDNVELEIIKKNAQDKIYELEKQIYLGRKLLERLEEEAKKPEWANRAQVIDKARMKLSVRTRNMLTTVNVLQQSIASIDIIVDNNDKLEESIFNAITMTKNIVTVSASIQMALINQKKVIDAVNSVNETTENMLVSNAKLLKQNTEQVVKSLEDPAIAMDKLRQAFNDVQSAIQTTEESNKRIIQNSKTFIEDIDKFNQEMKKKLQ